MSGMSEPQVTRYGVLDMQVCVPADWTDEQIKEFADRANWCGLEAGWRIRKEGDEDLNGDPERQACAQRPGFVHVMLDC
jgi:hypothetical protein